MMCFVQLYGSFSVSTVIAWCMNIVNGFTERIKTFIKRDLQFTESPTAHFEQRFAFLNAAKVEVDKRRNIYCPPICQRSQYYCTFYFNKYFLIYSYVLYNYCISNQGQIPPPPITIEQIQLLDNG